MGTVSRPWKSTAMSKESPTASRMLATRSTMPCTAAGVSMNSSCGTGQQYRDAIRTADGQVGRIVAAVRARATYAGENWLIMVATDHGHVDEGGHGGNNPNVR
ncbi:hypothetical protein [Streptomyces sp. NPDC057854]|uniref:hypothetical protein n=1 Tax=unclassified Streptomyces TaxID=2593676 RepID=UPI003673C402